MPISWLVLPAFAKINLSLELLGRRADGTWEIRTLYQTVALPDRIRLARSRRGPIVRVRGGGAPAGRSNLVHRGLREAGREFGLPLGVEVELEKTIPAGGGLGGGSSDAAAAVIGLLRLHRVRVPAAALFRLGARLGADVPFFFLGGRALGVGRGEEVYALEEEAERWCVLAVPPEPVLTRQAYGWAAASRLTPHARAAKIASPHRRRRELWARGNDFEPIVFARFPRLARMKAVLLGAGAGQAGLSGSGSSIYALFARRAAAERAAARLVAQMPPVAVFVVRTLAGDSYRRALGLDRVRVPP